jgi:hypothetical protein
LHLSRSGAVQGNPVRSADEPKPTQVEEDRSDARFDEKNVPGEGHIHLHIDGNKTARVYGEWFHLDPLPPGGQELSATLNTNDHRSYAVDGEVIEARAEVVEK